MGFYKTKCIRGKKIKKNNKKKTIMWQELYVSYPMGVKKRVNILFLLEQREMILKREYNIL